MKPLRAWAEAHPNLAAWAVLAIGMVAVLAFSARDVGLSASQWAWLILATVLVAGLSAWIISWEADEPEEAAAAAEAEADGEPAGHA
jgi:hypothetical protein